MGMFGSMIGWPGLLPGPGGNDPPVSPLDPNMFPPVEDDKVQDSSTSSVDSSVFSSRSEDPYTNYSNQQYFDDYLNMLKRGSEIGLFSTAQDVVNEAQKDRLFQSLEAEKERQWYEDLSNSAYQRQVKDLEAAGLNPILGWANFGSGASSAHAQVPQGTSTGLRATAPNLSDYLNAGANIVSSAGKILSAIAGLV